MGTIFISFIMSKDVDAWIRNQLAGLKNDKKKKAFSELGFGKNQSESVKPINKT